MANHTKGVAPPNKTVTAATDSKTKSDKIRIANKKPRQGAPLTVDKYNEMWEAYQIEQTPHSVAKRVGVARKTAQKYIEQGDPHRALRPLRERWTNVQLTAQQRSDYDLAKAKSDTMAVGRAVLAKVAATTKELDLAGKALTCPHCGGTVAHPINQMAAVKFVSQLKGIQDVLMRALGEPDRHAVEVSKADPFEGWSYQDLRRYAETGLLPSE